MSSKEIAELLDARHDNVKRAIERMAGLGVFTLPPVEEVSGTDPASSRCNNWTDAPASSWWPSSPTSSPHE